MIIQHPLVLHIVVLVLHVVICGLVAPTVGVGLVSIYKEALALMSTNAGGTQPSAPLMLIVTTLMDLTDVSVNVDS